MEVYFNWLGTEMKLDNENDSIHYMDPLDFMNNILNDNYSEAVKNIEYIDIQKDNYTYYVPITSIVSKEKNNNFTNQERWD